MTTFNKKAKNLIWTHNTRLEGSLKANRWLMIVVFKEIKPMSVFDLIAG